MINVGASVRNCDYIRLRKLKTSSKQGFCEVTDDDCVSVWFIFFVDYGIRLGYIKNYSRLQFSFRLGGGCLLFVVILVEYVKLIFRNFEHYFSCLCS